MIEKIPVVAVVGPTASGKTALGVAIAQRFNGEIVSADSMQVYRQLSIATAKPTVEEMQNIPHHMLDIKDVWEDFSVAEYCELASKNLVDIKSRNKLPIIVGGTGLYVDSLLSGADFSVQEHSDEIRCRLEKEYDEFGGENLLEKLKKCDESACYEMHSNNKKRLVRMLELYEITGLTKDERERKSHENESIFQPVYICISCKNRENLYDKINKRVDIMIENGLIDEVKQYYNYPQLSTSSQAIGVKELKPYLNGEKTLDECVEQLKQSTRRYAKRQLTWFLHNEKIHLLFTDELTKSDIIKRSCNIVNDFLSENNFFWEMKSE